MTRVFGCGMLANGFRRLRQEVDDQVRADRERTAERRAERDASYDSDMRSTPTLVPMAARPLAASVADEGRSRARAAQPPPISRCPTTTICRPHRSSRCSTASPLTNSPRIGTPTSGPTGTAVRCSASSPSSGDDRSASSADSTARTRANSANCRALEAEARAALVDQRGGPRWLDENTAVGDRWGEVCRDSIVWLAHIDEVVVGYIVGAVGDDRIARILDVYVTPGARELGFGDALLGMRSSVMPVVPMRPRSRGSRSRAIGRRRTSTSVRASSPG